ncbi:MAG: AAA family ATPase [Candidatus Diapherotrites archaeon]|nr:AAA family ATPase [Candidatus Diapherotrites archaeon]
MQRIPTGIPGFDELIEGGLPEGRSFLVSGSTGTGKTILTMQFVFEGIRKYKEPGIYVTLDERPNLLREDMLRFGWDLRKAENENQLQIIDGSVARIGMPSDEEFSISAGFDLDRLLVEVMRNARRIGAKRIVLDSIPALGFNYENENEVRKAILKISYMLERTGVTALLVTEVPEGSGQYSKYGVEEYVVDGIIVLHYASVGAQGNRTIHVRKMRATKHSEALHPLSITAKGIMVSKQERAYEEV